MAVRALFQLVSIEQSYYGTKVLKFDARYDTRIEEHARFAKATPSGKLEMQVDNPAAAEQFKIGEFYYLDFTPTAGP